MVDKHREEFNVQKHAGLGRANLEQTFELLRAERGKYLVHKEVCNVNNLELENGAQITVLQEQQRELLQHGAHLRQIQAKMEMYVKQRDVIPELVEHLTLPQRERNPSYVRWEGEISDLEVTRAMLDADWNVSIDNKNERGRILAGLIEKASTKLETMEPIITTVPQFTTMLPNPRRAEHESKIVDLQAEEYGLIKLIENISASVESTEKRLETLRVCEPIHEEFETEIRARALAYQKLSVTNAEVEALATLDVQPEANLQVWEPATLPSNKDGPRRSKFVLIGLFLGTALGCGIAVLLQMLDSRVRYPRTVEKTLGLPLLGVVPEVRSLRRLAPSRKVA
jgi:hypothetical protein